MNYTILPHIKVIEGQGVDKMKDSFFESSTGILQQWRLNLMSSTVFFYFELKYTSLTLLK